MRYLLLALMLGISMGVAQAQTQQAGADGGDAESLFQALIEKCDNTDLLIKRAKVRLLLSRIAEDKATIVQDKMDEGFAKCGEGELDAADALLDEAFAIGDAASTETYGTDASAEKEEAKKQEVKSEDMDQGAKDSSPWWKFW